MPVIPGAEDVFQKLDSLLREGREEEARKMADERVLNEGLGLDEREIKNLKQVRTDLMEWRRPSRGADGDA